MAAQTSTQAITRQSSRFDLPGLNLPLNWQPVYKRPTWNVFGIAPNTGEKALFPSVLNVEDVYNGQASSRLTPLREFTMLHIMNALTDKPGWEEKVFNNDIAEKWKREAMATEGRDVTQEMVDWVIEELRYKAEKFKSDGAISVYDGDVVKSDTAIPTALKEALQAAVSSLEHVQEFSKDYHPDSDRKVVDLVHPSLFPLIYGRSRVLPDSLIGLDDCIESCGKGDTVPIRPEIEMNSRTTGWEHATRLTYSKNYQWLPAEVEFSKDGTAKFSSYINNLHPVKYKNLYSIIETVIDKAIPLWNMSLAPIHRDSDQVYHARPCRIQYTEQVFDPDPEQMSEEDKPQQGPNEDEEAYWDRKDAWERNIRRVVLPNPKKFTPPELVEDKHLIDLKRDYASRGLQVIVKLANIELTPEKPTYGGGSWHVEGQMNEHICATALYYFSNSNISSSTLAFRQLVSDESIEISYGQDQHDFLSAVYGCENDGSTVQEIGSVACTEGRLLTFPNLLQHRVTPFSLADPTKPGHRKILALFLVDPGIRIISTANVPPQQRDWWAEAVLRDFDAPNSNKAFAKLSQEICDKVFQSVDSFPIGLDEAKDIRLSLMEERKDFVVRANVTLEETRFSLCEH